MKLSVNILTWNNIYPLSQTLTILKKDLRYIEHEIISVDNGSHDGCEKVATIANGANLGVSVGKNLALEASRGEYILMLDGDIVPVPNSVNLLIDFLDNNPEIHAVGFPPNKFVDQENKNGQKHHETFCHTLFEPKIHTQVIAYYGLFRKSMLDDYNIKFPEYGSFSGCGYGWEDSDVYMQMREKGVQQWVVGMNTAIGRYYHEINSSIREMGQDKYMSSSRQRRDDFRAKWGDKEKLYYA